MSENPQDLRKFSPSTARNRGPILEVLQRILPAQATVLEIASGSGEHGVFFCESMTGWRWQPTDRDQDALESVAAWRSHAKLEDSMAPPITLDVAEEGWPKQIPEPMDAIFAANMIHISPWESTVGLVNGAAQLLAPGAPLVLYGPYRINGAHTAPSNVTFEEWLQAQDSRWGVRDLNEVTDVALSRGFDEPQVHPMPANNLTVVFRRN